MEDGLVGIKGVNITDDAGAINILAGSNDGLADITPPGIYGPPSMWHQERVDVQSVALFGEEFGSSLAIGDFDNDGDGDLAVGIPGDTISSKRFPFIHPRSGAIQIFVSQLGNDWSGYRHIDSDSDGIKGAAERGDLYGFAVASGDFDGDGYADLAIGIPKEDIGKTVDAGGVNVIYGGANGLKSRDQYWHQNSKNPGHIEGENERGDRFGRALAVGDFDNDGVDDLAIGVPRESLYGVSKAGAVNVIYGSQSGQSAGQIPNRAPEANAGSDIVAVVDLTCAALVELDGQLSEDPDGDLISSHVWTIDGELVFGPIQILNLTLGYHSVSLVVGDGNLDSEPDEAEILVADGNRPDISCPAEVVAEAESNHLTSVDLGMPLVTNNFCGRIGTSNDAPAAFPLGLTNISWNIYSIDPIYIEDDDEVVRHEQVCSQDIVVIDTTPPSIKSLSATPSVLWSPNKSMRQVSVTVDVSDVVDDSPNCELVDIQVNQSTPSGRRRESPYEITGPDSALLLADRDGSEGDRRYTLRVNCTDFTGNTSSATTDVIVPHDRRR